MKRYVSLFLCSLSLLSPELFAQSTTAGAYLNRGLQMFADKNFAGCIDQMSEAKRYGLADDELADFYIALSLRNDVSALTDFLIKYPDSPYRHKVLCSIADYYLAVEGISHYALRNFEQADISALNGYDAEDATLHYGIALADEQMYKQAKTKFTALKGTRYDNEAEFYLGYIAYCSKDYATALKHFAAVRRNSSEPIRFTDYFVAQTYYLQKQFSKAFSTSSQIIKSASDEDSKRGFFTEMLRVNGESAYNTGQKAQAVSTLRKYESRKSDISFPARYILGEDEYNVGDYVSAVKYLSPVADDDSEMGQSAALLLGQSYLHLKKYDAALMALQKSYDMAYNQDIRESALYNYGIAKMNGGRMPFSSSVATFEQFLKEFPNSRYAPDVQKYIIKGYITDNNYESALKSINALSSPTEETLKAKQLILYTLGCRALNTSKADATTLNYAVGKLREAKSMVQYDKDIANECDLWIGEALYKQGKYSQAATSYKSYIRGAKKSAQNFVTAYYDLGYAQFGDKDFSAAYNSFNTFAESRVCDASLKADALNRMGDCLYYKSEFDRAATMYDKAFEAYPSAGDYALYQQAIMKGLRRKHSEKIDGLKNMISRFPNSGLYPSALLEMADAYQELGKTENTVSTYKTLVGKFPDTSQGRQGLLLLAITYLNSGRTENAVSTYKQIITTYPTSEEAKVAVDDLKRIYTDDSNIGEFLAFMKNIDNAPVIDKDEIEQLTFTSAENLFTNKNDISQINSYLKEYPSGTYTPQALFYKAQYCVAKGDDNGAIKAADKIITDYPHSAVTEDAYILLANAQTDLGMAMDALATYKALESRASSATVLNTARLGVMRTARDLGNAELTLEAADNLLASSTLGTNSREEITFTRGLALELLGRGDDAVVAWEELMSDLNHIYGTKATFYLAQHFYNSGNLQQARVYAEKIIDANPPHNYWVARTFILLSDINRAEGNTFEADEYLKVLKENYPGSEADIFTMIQERLNN